MFVFGALLVNIAVTLFFYLRAPKEYVWYELVLSLVITSGLIFGAKALADKHTAMFTEYWGETIIAVGEEEPYNWWHSKTCTETYACGTDADGNTEYCTRTYDCSEQEDEGPEWWCVTDLGNKYSMTEYYYDELNEMFGSNRSKIKTRKNHDSRDKAVRSRGTKFEGTRVGKESYIWRTEWNRIEETRRGVFTKHKYENRIQGSDLSLFNISVVSPEEADSAGLYHYPKKIDKYNLPVFLGGNISEETQTKYRRLNAKFGPSNQMRLWILVYEDKPMNVAIKQENYWAKGHKNELVLCIGINKNKEIQWSHAFSWAKSSVLTAEVKNKVLDLYEYEVTTTKGQKLPLAIPINEKMKKKVSEMIGIDTAYLPPVLPLKELGLTEQDITKVVRSDYPMLNDRTLNEFYEYLDENLEKFDRREFSEFYYLKVKPKKKHMIMVFVLSLIVSIGLNLWFSLNDVNHKPKRYRYRRRY